METVNKKQKKAGRPSKVVKKEIRAAVPFSGNEYFIIKEKAAQLGVKVSAYIRQTAINAKVNPRLTTEELHLIRQLAGMSGNLNQVAKVCHREGLFEAMLYFNNYRNPIDNILKKLNP